MGWFIRISCYREVTLSRYLFSLFTGRQYYNSLYIIAICIILWSNGYFQLLCISLNLAVMCDAVRLLQTWMCVWGDRTSSLPLCEAQLCRRGDISPLSSEAASVLWHHCDVSACHTGALKLAWIGEFGFSVLSPNLFLFIYLSSLLVFFLYACFFQWYFLSEFILALSWQ